MVSLNKSELDCFQLVNSNSVPYPYSYLYTIILIFIVLYGTPANILLIIGTYKTCSQLTTSKKLFILLSLSDLSTILIALPVQMYVVVFGQNIGCTLSAIQTFAFCFTPWMSGCIICVMSFTRYATVAAKQLKKLLLNRISKLILSLNLLASIIYATIVSVWCTMSYYYRLRFSLSIFFVSTGIIATILLTGVIMINIRLAHFVQRNTKGNSVKPSPYQLRVTKTVSTISVVTCICYAPAIIGWFCAAYFYLSDLQNKLIPQTFNSWLQVLVYMNCVIGPSIYIISSKLIKRLFKKHRPKIRDSYRLRLDKNQNGVRN